MSSEFKIAIVTRGALLPADISRLIRHLYRLDVFGFARLKEYASLAAAVIVADLENLTDQELLDAEPHLKRLKSGDQPMILICARGQLARIAQIGLLKGNNALSRPLDESNLNALVDRFIAFQKPKQGNPPEEPRPQQPKATPAVQSATASPPVEPPRPASNLLLPEKRTSLLRPTAMADGSVAPPPALPATEAGKAVSSVSNLLDRVFSMSRSTPITQAELGETTETLCSAIEELKLSGWVDTVRAHHTGTYQHCLLVAGTSVAFGTGFGLSDRDMRRVTAAALVHDVGKTAIPESILDKPGALTPEEMTIIRTHPLIGYDMMKQSTGFDAEMAEMVLSHHEFLDGSGYPHGLMNGQIADLVRVITIADIFSALIERRSYKPPLSGAKAYEIMTGMTGKLDMPLVRAQEKIMIAA